MTKPWISSNILNKCKYRDSLLHNISKEKDPRIKNDLHTDYKKLRNEITKEKCLSKKAYFTSYFEKNKQKSSDIWKGIRSLVNIKPLKSSSFKLLNDNKNLISDPSKISNIFSNHFATIGSVIEQNIPYAYGHIKNYFNMKNYEGQFHFNSADSFFLLPHWS